MVLTLLHFSPNRGNRLPKALPNQEEGEPDRISSLQHAALVRSEHSNEFELEDLHLLGAPSDSSGTHRTQCQLLGGAGPFFPRSDARAHPGAACPHSAGGDAAHAANFSESTVIEFGTPREVLFACKTPLEFADVLRLRNADGSFDNEVTVVAVQYHPGKTLVAARFLGEVPNWIVKS